MKYLVKNDYHFICETYKLIRTKLTQILYIYLNNFIFYNFM